MNELYSYYRNQALQRGGKLETSYFKGERYSTPYLGQYGGSWFHKIIPLVHKATNFAKGRTGKKIISSLATIGSDILSNVQREKNLKESVRDAIKKESKELLNQGLQQLQERISNRKRELEQSSSELLNGEGSGAYFLKRQKLLPNKYIQPFEDMKITDQCIQKLMKALQPRAKAKRKPTHRKKKKSVHRKRRTVKDKRKTKEIIKKILKPVLGGRKKTKRRVTFKLPGLLL
jgi:hypothetical protein